jgi:glycerol-3-phosphate acyltransferase PlsX
MAEETGAANASIAVDVMGSDLGPGEVIAGIGLALKSLEHLPKQFVLVGDEAAIKPALETEGLSNHPRIRIHHASQVIQMDEKPLKSLKSKKDSSMVRAIELVKEGEAQVVLSCGNTGSLMAGGTLKLRTIPGISRPALGVIIPNQSKHWVLIDAGANPNPAPENMVGNAILGKNYCKVALGIENPRVGLVSIGTEEGKGTEFINETHQLLKQVGGLINYQGPIEGFQLFNDTVDVAVCDGFVGNILLKSFEGLLSTLAGFLKQELTANLIRKMGALMSQGAFKAMKAQLRPERYSGAPLLGLNGDVLKAHGSSDRFAIEGALTIASQFIQQDIDHLIRDDVTKSVALLNEAVED